MTVRALDQVRSVKVKLGLLVAVSVTVAAVVGSVGTGGGVPFWLGIPVTVALALAITQLLAVGMTSPLREMTEAAQRMARGDHAVRVTATSRDEVGELARAFNRMAEDLDGVDRQRRELVANVSHELRTPLAALCAVLENLVDGVAEPDPAALRAALSQAERMSALVGDLLDLSRVDAGQASLDRQQVGVHDLLDEAVGEARVSGRDVTYAVEVAPVDLTVHGDPARLRQLVANLLDNAARHSPAGGTVGVTAIGRGADWVLEVTDQGPGVPAADRERVFERFGTLSDSEGGGGTGLGLAIARWVTDLHDGSIGFADPAPGHRGARAVVVLPLSPTRPRPTGPTQPQPQEPIVPSPPVPSSYAAPVPQAPRPAPPVPTSTLELMFGDFWPDRGLPGSVRVLLGAVAVGVLAGLVLPFRDLGLGTFSVVLAAGGLALAASRHRRDPFTLTCAGLCVLLAATSAVRDAEWIAVLCLLAAGALCTVGLVRGRSLPGFALGALALPLAGLRGLPWLGRSMRAVTGLGHGPALLRTALWSLLGVTVFGLLFASADALFASWVDAVVPDLDIDTFVLRSFVAVAVGGTALAAAYLGLNPPTVDREGGLQRPVAHRFEWLAPVLLVDGVFVVFLAAQATVIFGGHDYLRRTTGLTYAEYVHQGFGQLTVATALTVLVVWAAARKAPRATPADRAWLRGSLGLLCALTLVVVASALHRMHLYQEAYGFTRLRLLVDVFEVWLGLLVLAILAAGVTLRAAWLPRTALLGGVGLLLGLAAINPDAWIARHNLERYEETGKVDWYYLQGLSADAVPELATLPDDVVECALVGHGTGEGGDWLEWNLGRSRAEPLLREELAEWSYDDAVCAAGTSR
jgi:two-component system sensor histidine kinase BaeS